MRNLKQVFGKRLRLFRKTKRWTQSRLAEEANLSLDMVGRLERGQAAPSFESMARISAVLDVAPSRFFSNRMGGTDTNADLEAALERVCGALSGASLDEVRRIEKVVSALLDA
jgi:transcriptional regulator with XRE-family HTH domain